MEYEIYVEYFCLLRKKMESDDSVEPPDYNRNITCWHIPKYLDIIPTFE